MYQILAKINRNEDLLAFNITFNYISSLTVI